MAELRTEFEGRLDKQGYTVGNVDCRSGVSRLSSTLSFEIAQKDVSPLPETKDLPESIYGAAMMAIIRSSETEHKTVHGVSICVFAGLIFNVLMQFYVLSCTRLYICVPAVSKVRQLYSAFHQEVFINGAYSEDAWDSFDRAGDLCQIPLSQPMFFLAILVVWTATCWSDLSESFRYVRSWCQLHEPGDRGAVELATSDDYVVTMAAPKKTKVAVMVLILIPKVIIAIYLWWLGARWLTSTTSFQDLLLNAVALAFITELDELIYKVLVPEDIQALVSMYKIARRPYVQQWLHLGALENSHEHHQAMHGEADRARRRRIAKMLVTMLVVVIFPALYIRYLQDVIPHYHWDVHDLCQIRIETLQDVEF